jgi:tetratricopeptide (TPR) repeat protein
VNTSARAVFLSYASQDAEGAAYNIAQVYAARGESDSAFEWFERAYIQRDPGLTEIKPQPLLRPLHADPRSGAFLRKMRLAD